MPFKKYFTPQQAHKRLPLVRKIVGEILEKGQAGRAMLAQYKEEELPVEFLTMEAEVEGLMMELEELGCFYKDWNFQIGLVDFPAIIRGKR